MASLTVALCLYLLNINIKSTIVIFVGTVRDPFKTIEKKTLLASK